MIEKLKNTFIKEKIIILIAFSMILLFGFILPIIADVQRENRLDKEGIYTIATIEGFYDDHHSSPSIKYSYTYKAKLYYDFCSVESIDKSLKGKRYFLLFLADHPLTTKLLLKKEVTDNILKVPYFGWEKIPI